MIERAHQDGSISWKAMVGVAGCVAGLAVVYFGYGIGTESPQKHAAAEPAAAVQPKDKRPVRAMNLALGNMVYFARDLGFAVKSSGGAAVDPDRIAARIENQLHGVRELYRQELAGNETLAGSFVLHFRISPNGELGQIREHGGRMPDPGFKKAVVDQVAGWSFPELVSESVEVTCPLLFVHEGMDITTLVHWEKSLAGGSTKALAAHSPEKSSAPAPAAAKATAPAAPRVSGMPDKAGEPQFRIKYATSLRQHPNFSAPVLLTVTIGTRVTVLGRQGDWLEVRSRADGPTGFIRKEFVTPMEIARQ